MGNDVVFYYLEVTINGGRDIEGPAQKFYYYKDPKLTGMKPNKGPVRGGTKVKIQGTGLNHDCGCNKTARFGPLELQPFNATSDTSFFIEAPRVDIPDAVVAAVALNGQQYSKDIIIHQRDKENTYTYYSDPYVSAYTPKSGPSIGGTKIKLSGFGFSPVKEQDGNPD